MEGRFSTCWDAVGQLVVLVQKYTPAYSPLRNTGFGLQHTINLLGTYRIQATGPPESRDADHLELITQNMKPNSGCEKEDVELSRRSSRRSLIRMSPHTDETVSSVANTADPSTWPNFQPYSATPSVRVGENPLKA